MIDWHSHILPGIDDGSRSVADSLTMLHSLQTQGVDTVVATPHFRANRVSVDAFLERRQTAAATLRAETEKLPSLPRLLYGAEVEYYPGISQMTGLERLTIEGRNLLLLEMPFARWTEYVVRELLSLAGDDRFTVMVAHVERYWKQQDGKTRRRLVESGIGMQMNADHVVRVATRRQALGLLKKGVISFLGSDCHDPVSRPPKMGEARDIICRKLGSGVWEGFCSQGQSVLDRAYV